MFSKPAKTKKSATENFKSSSMFTDNFIKLAPKFYYKTKKFDSNYSFKLASRLSALSGILSLYFIVYVQ